MPSITRYRVFFAVEGLGLLVTMIAGYLASAPSGFFNVTRSAAILVLLGFACFGHKLAWIARAPHKWATMAGYVVLGHMCVLLWASQLNAGTALAAIVSMAIMAAMLDSQAWMRTALMGWVAGLLFTALIVPVADMSRVTFGGLAMLVAFIAYFAFAGFLSARQSLQRKELHLQTSQSFAGVGGWEIDLSDNALIWTDTATKLMGMDETYVNDDDFSKFIVDDPANEKLLHSVDRLINHLEPYDEICLLQRCDGSRFWSHAKGQATFVDGEPVRLMGVFNDITERIEKERALTEAKEAAESAAVARTQFLANMSHEIRTPMNGVIGMTSLLASSNLSEEDRHHVEVIRASGESLLMIINDILDFTKLDAGKLELEQAPFSLPQVLQHSVDIVRKQAEDKGLALTVNIASLQHDYFIGDETRLRQVLINLLANAVKFTHTGGITIDASVGFTPDGYGSMLVSVTDTGIGIHPKQQATLFDAFTQADASTTRKYGGTGLGLAICKDLIKAMGGELELERSDDQGTTFAFAITLPVAEQSETKPDIPHADDQARLHTDLRILLAEDNPVNQKVMVRMLQKLGLSAQVVEDGEQAILAANTDGFDVVFMDLQMPVMDGIAATRQIRENTGISQPHIVALTANVMPADRQACQKAGMDAFMAKPIRMEDLRSVLVVAGQLLSTKSSS